VNDGHVHSTASHVLLSVRLYIRAHAPALSTQERQCAAEKVASCVLLCILLAGSTIPSIAALDVLICFPFACREVLDRPPAGNPR
jgi:hypothetical protein